MIFTGRNASIKFTHVANFNFFAPQSDSFGGFLYAKFYTNVGDFNFKM